MNTIITRIIVGAMALVTTAALATEFHVAINGNDANRGTKDAPLRTIQRAADLAQPGDVVTVHEGVYRERINPPRGGASDRKRIVYQAAPGEKVEIKGSEVVKNWTKDQGDVWKATLPNAFFGDFNPYSDLIRGDWFNPKGREHHTGAVYLNGDWLIEAAKLDDVLMPPGTTPPAASAKKQYLVNLTWLRPGGGAEQNQRIPFAGWTGNHPLKKAPCSEGGECVGWLEPGDWVRSEPMEFKQPTDQIEIRASCASGGAVIEVRRDSASGELLGAGSIANTGGWQSWVSCKIHIKPLTGAQTLCLVFNTAGPVAPPAPFWFAKVDAANTTIWAQFKGVNPNEQLVEINVRRTVFYPDKPGRNFITVRGFTMRHAATPWAPPTAEQVGLIGTHWSKGWIIENNIVSHSICSGIALGKHGDQFDNTSADTAEGYVKTIERAHAHAIPWMKENIGHHIVRNNTISHCEQTGIVGSLGCSFSTVTGNVIHDIHIRRLFTGAEMAGIKFHGAIDVEISRNHIYRTCRGLWLDWMAQGTRVTRNLFHDNLSEDLFVEVDHGPFLVDNNIFLSPRALLVNSQGGAYVHNLMTGAVRVIHTEKRETPYHPAHSTVVAGLAGNPSGDDRYYNNLMAKQNDLTVYDAAKMPVFMSGNVFVAGAKPCKQEASPLVEPDFDPGIALVEKAGGFYLDITPGKDWDTAQKRQIITTRVLGRAKIPNLSYENPDGSLLKVDTDYFGKHRSKTHPTVGPFENPGEGALQIKVW